MNCKFAAASLFALLFAGCTNLPQADTATGSAAEMDRAMDDKLAQFCPIKDPTVDDRLVRARLVLAAATGYAYRSIQNYSTKSEIQEDAARTLNRLKPAYLALSAAEKHKDQLLFPLYRADSVIELAELAEAAVQPTVRSGRNLIGMVNVDRLLRLRNALIVLLEDKLYLEAYGDACKAYAAERDAVRATAAANERILLRCRSLAELAASPSQPATLCDSLK
ncbi:MAG: hypothetical protein JNJ60_03325 [Rhodocyclaceae bacterium]|nr:hypothetical protein [Rhodocyclaceae bacterium]